MTDVDGIQDQEMAVFHFFSLDYSLYDNIAGNSSNIESYSPSATGYTFNHLRNFSLSH